MFSIRLTSGPLLPYEFPNRHNRFLRFESESKGNDLRMDGVHQNEYTERAEKYFLEGYT
jgi:hypothetical protein